MGNVPREFEPSQDPPGPLPEPWESLVAPIVAAVYLTPHEGLEEQRRVAVRQVLRAAIRHAGDTETLEAKRRRFLARLRDDLTSSGIDPDSWLAETILATGIRLIDACLVAVERAGESRPDRSDEERP